MSIMLQISEDYQVTDQFTRTVIVPNRFDVKLLGQATWYLQSRITQLADYSIILDQSRYAALIAARYLPPLNDANILNERKTKYASPLLTSAVFT
jgi:hypothetical protein